MDNDERLTDMMLNVKSAKKPDPGKFKNALAVAIDPPNSRIVFCLTENGDDSTAAQESVPYASHLYSPEFMAELTDAAQSYADTHPLVRESAVTLLLPDGAIATDTVSVPNMNRRRNDEAIEAMITGLYKNEVELTINRCLAVQNKQVTAYSLAVLNNRLKNALVTALTDGGIAPHCITFAANAAVDAVSHLHSRMRTSSYMLLDIQEEIARIAFVAKGRTTGCYDLPFGYAMLKSGKVASEDMLFDHSIAELAVLNAREKAKAKQVTIAAHETASASEDGSTGDSLDAMFGTDENATADPTLAVTLGPIKTLPKKQPRKLPKFMLRPDPRNDQECGYENFRIFMKWVLNLLASNEKLTMQGTPEAVYVNIPEELAYLLEWATNESAENGIEFRRLEIHADHAIAVEHLDLYGARFAPRYNHNNNFI